jgi:hypothetical protein
MDMDEVEVALENKLAAKDAVLVESPLEDELLPLVSVEDFVSCSCKGIAVDGGGHLKLHQWITPEMMLLTKVQIHYLHLNYIYYIRLVCALL